MSTFSKLLFPFILLIFIFSCDWKIKPADSFKPTSDLALKPPMGWNSYNCFGGNVTEEEVKANADYMAKNLKPYGWEYIVVDFLWYCDDQDSPEKFWNRRPEQHIDEFGRLIPSTILHPSSADGKGFKPLADYVHSKGLKFGIHIMRGIPRQAVDGNTPIKNSAAKGSEVANLPDTCVWYGGLVGVNLTKEGGQEYYNSLFELYAEWGVDYIKVDDIVYPYHADEIEAVHKAILNCGRPIVLSLSPGPAFIGNPKHLRENANLWRISGDFWDKWPALTRQLELCRDWAPHVAEGHWPDADMLPLGKLNIRTELKDANPRFTNFTKDEQYFLMTLWSIFRSPLMFGGHMPENDDFTLSLITNEEVLRVNQFSKNNREILFADSVSIWSADDVEKPVKYIALLNIGETSKTVAIPLELAGINGTATIRDLWKKEDITESVNSFVVPPHGAFLLSITQ
ncbi:MAG: glycoside hydrolase family 27 protein [Cyclobacteriaceae bacterium]|nr:glycoside hydrolase family 27 protein [Cyclobacteriaceae bacterium]